MLKRLFDILISLLALIIFCVPFLILGVMIKLESKGPVFFRQARVGKDGKIFMIHKFRSMKERNSDLLLTIGDDERITRVGKYIRKLHLDELCQTIDVLLGHMSLVGPRPETPNFTAYYEDDWKEVLKVKPGITGLSSIKYSHVEYKLLAAATDPEKLYIKQILPKKLRYEKFYVNHQSLSFDCYIIFLTLKYFLRAIIALSK